MTRDLPLDLLEQARRITRNLPPPTLEYRFHPVRRWRLDMVWLPEKVAVECHGNVWAGRHTRGVGFSNDREKSNVAQLFGFLVLEFTSGQVDNDPVGCVTQLVEALRIRGNADVELTI